MPVTPPSDVVLPVEIAGVRREWEARILEQIPNEKIAWAATSGATNAGAVYFAALGPTQTSVALHLEYEPEGVVEKAGDALNIVERRAQADLEKFKSFIESRGFESGAWRGSINEGTGVGTPGAEAAASSQGDSGKAGLSPKTIAAGAAAAVAGAAAAGAMKGSSSGDTGSGETMETGSGANISAYPTESETVVSGTTTGETFDTSIEQPATPVASPVGFESPETVESADDFDSPGRSM